MAKLLGIDVGTSGVKVLLVDENGTVLKSASAEYPISTPRPLWSEQDPEHWWAGVQACLSEIGEVPDAVGLTGQMHGAVFLDENDAVIRPAILWNDQRTAAECAFIDAAVGPERLRSITGNPPLTGFQLPKVLWLREHEPENFARMHTVLLPKDYIRFKLTGTKATDVSDASGTGAFDLARRDWSSEVLSAVGLDPSLFPPAFESYQLTPGSWNGVPVAAGAGDQAAAAVGTGAVVPGVVSVSLGTSGVVFTTLALPQVDPEGSVHTFCHANGGWHAMGVMLSCGGALRWFRDTVMPGSSYEAITALAAEAEAGCEGLTFLPYLAGERTPHNDPLARAAWAGMTMRHGRPELARSVLEGVTYGLADGMNRLKALGADSKELRVTSGGAKSPFWRQLISDVFGAECVTLQIDEGPAFGAALLAGVGIALFSDVETAARVVREQDRTHPSSQSYDLSYARYRTLYPNLVSWDK